MTAQEYVYQRLRLALITGNIAPGVALTIRGLSSTLDISPTPIREALRRLSSEKAVEVLENRRIVVPLMTSERFTELVSLRAAVESHAAFRSVPYISDLAVDQLEVIDSALDKAVEDGDLEQQIVLNQTFHRQMYAANPHQLSSPVVDSIWLQLGPFMRIAGRHVQDLYLVDRHREAIAALRQRDAKALQQAIYADIHDGAACLGTAGVEKILHADTSQFATQESENDG